MNQNNEVDLAKEIAEAQVLAIQRRNEATERIRIKKLADDGGWINESIKLVPSLIRSIKDELKEMSDDQLVGRNVSVSIDRQFNSICRSQPAIELLKKEILKLGFIFDDLIENESSGAYAWGIIIMKYPDIG